MYLGDRLGFYRALDRVGSVTSAELAKETGTFERLTREWLEQQAAAGILDVDDASAEADARRYLLPAGHAEPLLDLDSPYSIAPVCKSFVAVSERHARPRRLVPLRGRSAVERLRPRHDRRAGRLQPAVARRLPRHRVRALDPGHPRRLADEPGAHGRRRRVRGRLGRHLARPGVSRTSSVDGFDLDELSIEIALQERGGSGGRGSRAVRGERRRGSRTGRTGTTSRSWWSRSTTCRSRSRS